DVLTVVRDPMHVVDTWKGSILTDDLGGRSLHASRSYSIGRGAGSNNVVVNPGTGGVIQRRARPRPNDRTLPPAASEPNAPCTVRWLLPSASGKAQPDRDS